MQAVVASLSKVSNVGLPRDLLCAIGHVAALWAQLEYLIDSATRQALDHPGAPESNTALILRFHERVKLLITCALPLLDREADRRHLKELGTTVRRLQHLRDLIVHGSISHSGFEKDGTVKYAFRRIRWERPIRLLERRSFSVEQLESIASDISDAVAIAGLFELIIWARSRPTGQGERAQGSFVATGNSGVEEKLSPIASAKPKPERTTKPSTRAPQRSASSGHVRKPRSKPEPADS